MKKFSIKIISETPKKIYGLLSHTGEITMGDYKETFVMPLNNWTGQDYEKQWQDGLNRIKTHPNSCLVRLVQNMDKNPMVEMWVLYKAGNTVYIQQHLLNKEIIREYQLPLNILNFNIKNCYTFIGPRIENDQGCGITEDGTMISEWRIDIKDF